MRSANDLSFGVDDFDLTQNRDVNEPPSAVFSAWRALVASYLLLSMFPRAVRALPRLGAWMNTFKQVMAFPLYVTVAYLVWVLAGQTTENGLLTVLFGLTLVAWAIWFYGHYNAPGASRGRARFAFAGALALLAVGFPRRYRKF